jgi:hypothetical protein
MRSSDACITVMLLQAEGICEFTLKAQYLFIICLLLLSVYSSSVCLKAHRLLSLFTFSHISCHVRSTYNVSGIERTDKSGCKNE